LGGVYYVIMSGSRIADDAEAYQAACDSNVPDWVKTDDFILVIQVGTSKGPISRAYKLMWRNVTDGGSFADVGSSGEITFNASTSLVDDDPFTPNTGCAADEPNPETGLESKGDNILPDSGTFTHSDDYYTEFAFALDCSNAIAGKEYAFQFYDVTESQIIGVCGATITMETAAAIPKAVVDTIDSANVFEAATILQAKSFADIISGADVFTQIWRAMGFSDAVAGTDVFETLYREMGFIDSISEADVFEATSLLVPKGFTDTVGGSDAFTLLRFLDFVDLLSGDDVWTLLRPMYFTDIVGGSDSFETPYKELPVADTVLGSDIFTMLLASGVVEKFIVDTGEGLDVFWCPVILDFTDTLGGIDVFLVTKPEVVLRITAADFSQILITDGSLRQVNITMEDI